MGMDMLRTGRTIDARRAKRIGLVRLACWFNQNRGVVTVCQIVKGDLERERRKSSGHEKHIRHLEKKVKLLVEALDRMEQPAPALPSGSS